MKPVLGVLLAAVATFMFGFVFWAVLDVPGNAMKSFDDDAAVQSALTDLFDESGTYFYPDHELYTADEDAFNAAYEAGPLAVIHVRKEGSPAMDPMQLGMGFLHNLATWALVAVVLTMAAPALRTYGSRVIAVALTGVAISIWIFGAQVIWFPIDFTWAFINGVDNALAWLIAGLVLAAFIKPAST